MRPKSRSFGRRSSLPPTLTWPPRNAAISTSGRTLVIRPGLRLLTLLSCSGLRRLVRRVPHHGPCVILSGYQVSQDERRIHRTPSPRVTSFCLQSDSLALSKSKVLAAGHQSPISNLQV